jgi:hypothetical protein
MATSIFSMPQLSTRSSNWRPSFAQAIESGVGWHHEREPTALLGTQPFVADLDPQNIE